MLISVANAPADERGPRRLLIRFRLPSSETAGRRPVRLSPGTRLLTRLDIDQTALFRAPGRLARRALVLSPFCALDRPAASPLKIKKMAAIHPGDSLCTAARLGRLRIFAAPVDGLDDGRRYAAFRKVVGRGGVRLIILDGAERLSPWSDRFDPLSDGLVRFLDALEKDHPRLILLAITDRTEAVVRQDIRARLKAGEETAAPRWSGVAGSGSFQVIRAYGQEQKESAYGRVVKKDIPAALGERTASGTVFAPAPPGAGTGLEIRLTADDPGDIDAGPTARPLSVPSHRPRYRHPFHRPAHALETPFPEKAAGGFHDVLIVSDGGRKPARGRFILDIALDGGLDRWVRLAFSGTDRHCLHLADLPSDLCETDMSSRGVPVPRCGEEGCPLGKNALCDYGRRHLAIQRFGPDPATETLETLGTLARLLIRSDAGEDPVRITGEENGRKTALALGRLTAIGVLAAFRILGPGGFEAAGLRPSIQATEMAAAAEAWRQRLGLAPKYRPRIQAPLKAAVAGGSVRSHPKHDRLVEDAADVLTSVLDPLARAVREMAYRRLWNLKTFLRGRDCRRAALIRHYAPVDPEWRCGRCDICKPDLDFDRTTDAAFPAPAPDRRAAAEELERWLAGPMADFDPDEGDAARGLFKDDPAYLYQRCAAVLEGDPRNLRALYLARSCAPENAVNMTHLSLMRSARGRLPFPQVRRLYEGSAESAKPLIFDVLDDVFGPAACAEGESLLFRESKRLSLTRRRTDWLRARRAVESLRNIDFTAWKTRLHTYLEEA